MNTLGSNSDAADWLVNTVRKNPEGLLLLGAGLALLMRAGGSRAAQASSASSTSYGGGNGPYGPYGMSAAREGAQHGVEPMRSGMSDVRDRAADQARNTAEQLRSTASDAAQSMSRSFDQVQGQAQTAVNTAMQSGQKLANAAMESGQSMMTSAVQSGQQVVQSIAAQPLLVALMGLGTGLALASLIPESAIEHRALQDAGKTLAEKARDVGSRVASATSEVGDKLAQEAEQRRLNKDGVQELAGTLTDTFTNALGERGTDKSTGAQDEAHEAAPGSQFS
jgi:hypothetical protein